jgi:hypothetical protein
MAFLAPFAALFALGLTGIASLAPVLARAVPQMRAAVAPDLPDAALVALSLLQPTIMLAILVAAGVSLHERVGLRSVVAERARGRPGGSGPPRGVVAMLLAVTVLAALVVCVDLGLRRVAPEAFPALPRLGDGDVAARAMALLYGGITEELLMRFGLMTVLVWAGIKLGGGREEVARAAILIVALLFGAGHLPALLAHGAPEPALVARTVLLNAALGLFYGWVYWRRTLEHAMLAHAWTHVVFWAATPLLSRLI